MALNKEFKREILKPALILLAITFVCTAILAVVNGFTSVVINDNKLKSQEFSRETVLPVAESFEPLDESPLAYVDMRYPVTQCYKGIKNGETVGYTACVSPMGYGGSIEMVLGFDTKYNITGIDIISMSETPGLGAKVKEPEFISGVVGKNANIGITVVSGEIKRNNEINAVTGATISSKAVTEGVNCAVSALKIVTKEL